MTIEETEKVIQRYAALVGRASCVPPAKSATQGAWCKAIDLRRQWFATRTMSGFPNTIKGNKVEPLIDGSEMLQRLHVDLIGASSYFFLTGLRYSADMRLVRTGPLTDKADDPWSFEHVVDVLTKKANPVQVRILMFAVAGVFGMVDGRLALWKDHCQVRTFGGVCVNGCLHQKTAIIDGKIAYCGGIDVVHDEYGDRWDTKRHVANDPKRWPVDKQGQNRRNWHDIHLRVEGPAVEVIQENFLRHWQMASQEYSRKSMLGWGGRSGANLYHEKGARGHVQVQVARTIPAKPPEIAPMPSRFRPPSEKPVQPDHAEYSIVETSARAIVNAQHYIYIENQYFSCGVLIRLMVSRLMANRGLHLILLLPQDFEETMRGDSAFRKGVIEKRPSQTISPAVAVDWLRTVAPDRVIVAYPVNSAGGEVYVHAKIMIVDDKYASVGSANISERSMFVADHELALVWMDRPSVKEFRKALWSEHLDIPEKDSRLDASDARSLARLWGPAAPKQIKPVHSSKQIRRWDELKVDPERRKTLSAKRGIKKGAKSDPYMLEDVDVGSVSVKCLGGSIRVELFTNQYIGDEKCAEKVVSAGESWSYVFPTRGLGDQDNKAVITGLAGYSSWEMSMVAYDK